MMKKFLLPGYQLCKDQRSIKSVFVDEFVAVQDFAEFPIVKQSLCHASHRAHGA